MKTLIAFIATSIILFSCTKGDEARILADESPNYYGEYHSSKGDTATLSGANGFLYIRFAPKNTFGGRFIMDSLRLNSDNTVLCNEYTKREDVNGKTFPVETVIGSGKLGDGMLDFKVTLASGSTVTYSGVKKQ